MGRTLTNNVSLEYAFEESIGVLPASPDWKLLEPNAINTFGASITTVARNPISKNRQRRKGTVTDLDSAVEFDADFTLDSFKDFMEGFVFANFTGQVYTSPTDVSTTDYTVPAMSAAIVQNSLVYARGFLNAANNGLKVVDTGGTTTSVPIVGGGLVAETPAATRNVSLEVAGFRFSSGDLQVDASGDLIATTKDLTTLGLIPGQMIWIGGASADYQFASTEDTGFARVVSVVAGKIVLDKRSQDFVADTGTGKTIELYFGRFLKNVAVDDSNFLERSFHFEAAYQDLEGNPVPTGDAYEYAVGNYCNTVGFELPLTDKATATFAFVGTDTDVPTTTRKTNADSPRVPVETSAFNTSADIARLRITDVDETGLTTDFKSVTLNINNNVAPEKVLGNLGARFMNYGNFEIDIEAQLLFTDGAVVEAIRNNQTLTMDFSIRNDDGGIAVDIPSLTLGGGEKEFPVNESILINTTAQAFGDAIFNSSLHVSMFPYLPPVA